MGFASYLSVSDSSYSSSSSSSEKLALTFLLPSLFLSLVAKGLKPIPFLLGYDSSFVRFESFHILVFIMGMQRNDPVDRIPLFVSALNGAILVPSFMAIPADMPVNLRLSMLLLVLSMLSAALSSFLTSGLRGRAWGRCVGDGLLSAATFFLSGSIPLLFSAVLPDRFDRIQFLVGVTFIMVGAILVVYLVMRDKKMIPLIPQDAPFPWLVFSIGW
ncbi:hypothetical protein DY000_02006003 [Brassica cretica]|uniref:EamA domain-containing protein n=1 Tax=Brassica cretica TaxID=69181 RepID=A0ABQ7CAL5_BRACR|nr:hypothetical protein DY000_02006003 [Brassica cretica]